MKSKDLRSYGNCCGKIGAKILRLRASHSAQDDKTVGGAMIRSAQGDNLVGFGNMLSWQDIPVGNVL